MNKQDNKPETKLARSIAKNLLNETKIKNPPVIIRHVIIYLRKNIKLEVLPWSFGDKTDGIQLTKGTLKIIGYNKSQHPHRQRFTVAHEIGHLLLGHTIIENRSSLDLNSNDPHEIEANQFAAELLMPTKMLEVSLSKKEDIKDIANKYNVSEKSLWWQIYNRNLINKI